jgi:glycosyltransferase involved in cell wall biosynthesis
MTRDATDNGLGALTDPALDALFDWPSRHGVESAWYGHVPFAAWIVAACRPRVLVELGTHTGVSYAALCAAVQRHALPTRCFAVDTWEGDVHAGLYGEAVYQDFRGFHDRHFAGFSTLLRMTFDEARESLAGTAIDLLHIDGLHSYEAVRHDFENWLPLLSPRAVVLFHDTVERERGFGVWRLWQELRDRHPGFEFVHCHGLGVLAVGGDIPPAVAALCAASQDGSAVAVRQRFAALGERWQKEMDLDLLRQELANDTERRRALRAELRKARTLNDQAQARIRDLHAILDELEPLRQLSKDLAYDYQRVVNSTLWRALGPVRAVGELIPVPLRRGLGSALRAALGKRRRAAPPPEAAETVAEARNPDGGRVVFISGEPHTPGHTYRVLRQTEAAIRAGRDALWLSIDDADRGMKAIATASVVVIWRAIWSDTVSRIIETARGVGAKVLFDVDDLLFLPELANAGIIDAIRSQKMDPDEVGEHFAKSLEVVVAVDACSCTTMELARHIRGCAKTTYVLPNGFDASNHAASRLAVRRRRAAADDGKLRICYAAGTRTHQRDFAQAAAAVARVLRDYPQCRLVLFEPPDATEPPLDISEFSAVSGRADQVEWRTMVALDRLPDELARFDINIAPLEFDNPFCEAKSELKYFEAALVEVPTIASPTGPLRRAIRHGETGMLAATVDDWYAALTALIEDAGLRRRMAHAAYLDVLWPFGPERRAERMGAMLRQLRGGPEAAQAFALEVARDRAPPAGAIALPATETVFAHDALGQAAVSVIIPLFNYAAFVAEALESVRAQTMDALDLIVIDDASTDGSLAVAVEWAERNHARFNRLLVLRNRANAGLARTRNAGFDAAETPYVLPLDADNVLLPACCARTLEMAEAGHAAFAYPAIQYFGGKDHEIGTLAFAPMGLAGGNYIDAMALVSKPAWAAVGGYVHIEHGWEDYDFWCRFAERGLLGVKVREVLAEYRVHRASMLHTATDVADNKPLLVADMEGRHGWLSITT